MELTEQLKELTGVISTFKEKAQEEIKSLGGVQAETKSALEALSAKLDKVQTQADAIDLKMSKRLVDGGEEKTTIGRLVTENEKYQEAKGHGFAGSKPLTIHLKAGLFEKKTITEGGFSAGSGSVISRTLLPDRALLPIQGFRLRDLLKVRRLDTGYAYDWVRQTTRTNNASPVAEGTTKPESTSAWDVQSDTVKTIAHWMRISRQALDDIPWLQDAIDTDLRYGLLFKEEQEILAGDGTGQHMNGILTQATAFTTTYVTSISRYTQLEQLRYAKLQARLAGLATYAPDAFVLHPTDMANIELIRDDSGGVSRTGMYIIGDPKTGTEFKTLWGIPVVESDSMTQGQFLVGSFGQAATLIDRQATTVEISYEDQDNFVKNLVTILCEERVGLAVTRPGAFIKGTFATSPATA